MSVLPFGLDLALNAILDPLLGVIIRPRSIGGFVANVTVEEVHTDELAVTDHPVERNSVISDHAYKRPEQVTIRAGYSNSSPQGLSNPNYINDTYTQFLALQESREPFEIITGKRFYQNMMMTRLHVVTDEKNENILMMTVDCREVIIVDTQVVAFPPTASQQSPEVTAPTQNRGTITIRPGPTSSGFNPVAAAQSLPPDTGFSF